MANSDHRTYRAVIRAVRLAFGAFDVRFDVEGAEHIPSTGPAVIAANHIGYLDFTFVEYAAFERGRFVRFMAKQSTFANPVSGPLMRQMQHIPVDRDGVLAGAVAYRRAIRAVQAGEIVGVFPESTISRSWRLRAFKPGAAALAVREQVPLIPVVTWGGHRLATTDGHVHPQRHIPVLIRIGEPIRPTLDRDATGSVLRARMTELLDDAQSNYPIDGAGAWWQPGCRGGSAPDAEGAARLEAEVDEARRIKKHERHLKKSAR